MGLGGIVGWFIGGLFYAWAGYYGVTHRNPLFKLFGVMFFIGVPMLLGWMAYYRMIGEAVSLVVGFGLGLYLVWKYVRKPGQQQGQQISPAMSPGR